MTRPCINDAAIGAEAGYSPQQIAEYGALLRSVEQWMALMLPDKNEVKES